MEIRALTGFDLGTREQFGRSYSPLSGCNPALGAIGSQRGGQPEFAIPYDIPAYIPPQPIEMIDVNTGKKKVFTVENAQALAKLIQQGYNIYSQIKGGSGSQKVVVVRSSNSIPPPSTAGINTKSIIGIGVAALIMISLYLSVKNK
tara:strand:- start:63 stop:500 length:438 start_codon:yes stop_codon:yes gene_type:complete